ncbi:rhamnulokinase [Schaalia hyovaginalis]|uniref:Rhamnulokinase n=1 Tax=Schaalia hyovaginalis TaxID=29316 RepID=A0A923IYW9_9ACTO|nr:rhamnulokinase family protein [Schaalia hyovaginalis]MBB6334084.1 rhamnulokinase [Schaalia hyovaginalis]
MTTALAVDLGSASGRVLAGTIVDDRIEVTDIHRFKHQAIRKNGSLIWDVDTMLEETIIGLRKAVELFPDSVSVSVDTWGVDFVPLDEDDERVGEARAYRDERTTRTLERFRELVDDRVFFDMSGNQPATINTANQLVAFRLEDPELAARTRRILFLPDYFAFRLSGVKGWSRTIASTSGLCEPGARRFNDEMFTRLGIERSWVGELDEDLTVVGPCTVPGLERLTVVRGGAHDSACAVHGLPIDEGVRAYFLSAGSWSVLGAIEAAPIMSDAAYEIGLTNEGRTDGGVRPLFNITGMWILQEIQRQWEREGTPTDTDELVAQARACAPCTHFFDPDDPRFAEPGEMQQKIDAALDEQGAPHPSSMPEYVRLIIESFARRYARAVDDLARISGTRPDQLNIVGGGSRNRLLCDLTARLAKVRVVAGPIEASTLGSLLAQLEILGHLNPADRPSIIAASAKTHVHTPARD